jgi:hypothetical protein
MFQKSWQHPHSLSDSAKNELSIEVLQVWRFIERLKIDPQKHKNMTAIDLEIATKMSLAPYQINVSRNG